MKLIFFTHRTAGDTVVTAQLLGLPRSGGRIHILFLHLYQMEREREVGILGKLFDQESTFAADVNVSGALSSVVRQ